MNVERIDTAVPGQWIRVGLVQLTYMPRLSAPPRDFGWHLDDSEKKAVRHKIFSALDLARSESVNIICFPELCLCREWVEEVKAEYQDMIVIGGSYYHEGYNICPVIIHGRVYDIRKIHPSPNTEGEVEPGRGMKRGDEPVIFHTRYGKFAVLICLDYREEAHKILTSSDASIRDIDFIFNPSYNADIFNFQERANQDCQMGNYPYIIQVNGLGAGSCIICMDHNVALERYRLEGYKASNDAIKYKFIQLEGEMAAIVDLDIRRKAVPVPATGFKMKTRGRYTYADQGWHKITAGTAAPEPKSIKAQATPGTTEGERKQATVLCAGITGFSALPEKLDPEEVSAATNDFFTMVKECVERHGGTVDKFMGDSVTALFGVPKALEDAPRRALNASLEIRDGMGKFSAEQRLAVPLEVTIGINTGTVVTGMAGSDKKQDFTITGDTVNLAGHLARSTEPGTIQVSENTYRQTEVYFEFESLGDLKIKSRKLPVTAYKLLGARQAATRLDASLGKGLTPFVGRNRELDHFRACYEKIVDGSGQVVGVVGEPGIGKSRLIREFIRSLATEEYIFLEGGCIHYGEAVLYLPILDILRACFNIRDDDEAAIKIKIQAKIAEFPGQLTHLLPPLYEVLSLKVEDEAFSRLEPRLRRDRVFEAIRLVLIAESRKKPLLVVVDDLQGIDKISDEFLAYLIGGMANNRIMLVLLFRPDYTPSWAGKSYYSQLWLDQFSRKTSADFIRSILAGSDVEPGLNDLIVNKSEGNPLFMEELTRDLMESGAIKKTGDKYMLCCAPNEIQIPDTIQGIIAARLDRLEENLKRVLQVASVIGRDFSFRILQAVAGSVDSLQFSLRTLQGLEFIYEKTLLPDLVYYFKHALTREVAYNSLLLKRRKETHEKVGRTIERMYADRLEEFYETIAYHFFMSENYAKAAEYYRLAGRKAVSAGAYLDAIALFKRRVTSLEKLPVTDEVQKKMIDARTAHALSLATLNHYAEAKEAIEPIYNLAVKLGYNYRLGQIYTIMGTYYSFTLENYELAHQEYEKALKVSEETKDIVTSSMASYWFGCSLSLCCEFEKALIHINKFIDILVARKVLWSVAITKATFAVTNCHQGKLNLAYLTAKEAIRIAEESGNSFSKGVAYFSYGLNCYCKRLIEEAEKNLLKGFEFCDKIDENFWKFSALLYLGGLYFEMGNYIKAGEYYEKTYRVLNENRLFPSSAGIAKAGLIKSQVMNNEKDVDLEFLYTLSYNNKSTILESAIAHTIGEILLHIDDQHFAEAEHWILKAIDSDRRYGMRFNLGGDYALYAELCKRKGDSSKARENLAKAIEILTECGADGWVEKYEGELAGL